eukprot:c18127_g1_i1.p2 GENE.c18127_g1_i1~~c18127_g1_i1.p2  ORF type:complete len:100 (-),score=17.09 c18127_g1_i1:94-393(-)
MCQACVLGKQGCVTSSAFENHFHISDQTKEQNKHVNAQCCQSEFNTWLAGESTFHFTHTVTHFVCSFYRKPEARSMMSLIDCAKCQARKISERKRSQSE